MEAAAMHPAAHVIAGPGEVVPWHPADHVLLLRIGLASGKDQHCRHHRAKLQYVNISHAHPLRLSTSAAYWDDY
jgi:hypothetical protein